MVRAKASELRLSKAQEEILTRLCRRRSSAQQQVKRARIILAAASGSSNSEIARRLRCDRNTVRLWRERWQASASELAEVELEQVAKDKELLSAIETVLSDAYRSGTPPSFSPEQMVQIIALACEAPNLSGRPVSHWTPHELADEAVKRGIVESISPQTVERFFKGSGTQTPSIALLANERAKPESRGI